MNLNRVENLNMLKEDSFCVKIFIEVLYKKTKIRLRGLKA